MKIADKAVVSINYTLTDDDDKIIDTSEGKKPLNYLHGARNIIAGLESELLGKSVGDKLKVTVKPEDGYGLVNPELLQEVPKAAFQGIDDIQPGMQFQAQDEQGNAQLIVVRKVDGDNVTIDRNHPLAGQTLHFDVSVEAIREATKEELDHGHVH